jgi:hypothetical protein
MGDLHRALLSRADRPLPSWLDTVAKAKGKAPGTEAQALPAQEAHLVALHSAGDHTVAELGKLFSVEREIVYRAVERSSVQDSTTLTLPRVDEPAAD